MFALTRNLAKQRDVTEIVVPLETVQRHLLGPLAAKAGAAACRNDLIRSTVTWAWFTRDVPVIVERLRSAEIRVAPIKGLAYAAGLYLAPVDRPMTDIDLLVEPEREATAKVVLAELGFERAAGPAIHHATTWARDGLVIDLHRSIVSEGRSQIDLGAVWARMRPGWPAGAERLDPLDELIFHLVHMARNRLCGPLVQVVDAVRLAARAPIAEALERADAWGLGDAAAAAWRFVSNIVEGEGRGGWLAPSIADLLAVRQPSIARKIVFDVATAGSPRQLAARTIAFLRR